MEFCLGVYEMQEANRIKANLENQGVSLETRFNNQTCKTGCQVTVELWGKEPDQPLILEFFKKEFERDLAGHELNQEQMSQVFDPEKDEVTCQACGHNFKPSSNECPNCGLCY